MTLAVLFLLVAVILFGIAAVGVSSGRINLVAAGLFCLALERLLTLGHVL